MKDRRLVVLVEADLWQAVHEAAEADDRSVASLVRLALREYLGRSGTPESTPKPP